MDGQGYLWGVERPGGGRGGEVRREVASDGLRKGVGALLWEQQGGKHGKLPWALPPAFASLPLEAKKAMGGNLSIFSRTGLQAIAS